MRYFKGKQFKKDIILVAVGYYCRFSLSYRDVSEILKNVAFQFIQQPSCDGFMNMKILSIKFGK
jgi:transposase-like protein